MENSIHTITLMSAYIPSAVEDYLSSKFHSLYNVKGKYTRYSDQYSTWTLTGTLKNLKECISKEWTTDFETVIEDEDELSLLTEN